MNEQPPATYPTDVPYNQRFAGLHVYWAEDSGRVKRTILAWTDEQAQEIAASMGAKKPPARLGLGRYSCPSCGCRYTSSSQNLGCVFVVFVFVSIGLALIAIPFLPHQCSCPACGFSWKS